mmetsp:Transcript_51956/g.161215  ORF Transcript_51956/g.161215 Transcript_51956/m.161215 type:complete len:288 (-) Transcript_51956:3989-4852(-)
MATVHDDGKVELQDGLQAVCDDNHRGLGEGLLDGGLQQLLRARVNRRCGLVQQQQHGLPDDVPGEAEQLPLTEAQVRPLARNRILEAAREVLHIVCHANELERLPDSAVRVHLERVDVEAQCALQEHRVLRDEANGRPQRPQPNGLRVHALHVDGAATRLQHAEERQEQGRLAATRGAHHARLESPRDRDADAVQDVRGDVCVAHAQLLDVNLDSVGEPTTDDVEQDLLGVAVAELVDHVRGLLREAIDCHDAVPWVCLAQPRVAWREVAHRLPLGHHKARLVRELL